MLELGYTYCKNKLKLNLCLLYAYRNVNLKHDFKDSYSGILYCLNTTCSFSFFSMKNLLIIENTALQLEKAPILTTVLLFYQLCGC